MAVGPTAGAFAFDKRAGQHFAERTEAADEFAAQFQVGLAGRFHMTLMLVSEPDEVKGPRRFARMPSKRTRCGNPAKLRPGADAGPYLKESLGSPRRHRRTVTASALRRVGQH